MDVLQSQTAFKQHYTQNPIVLKAIGSGIFGLGSAGAIIWVGGAAGKAVALSASTVAFANHFVAWPLIGGSATSYIAEKGSQGMLNGLTGAIPFAIIVGVIVFSVLFFVLFRLRKNIQKDSGLDSLAEIVSEFVFLPMFAKYNEYIKSSPNLIEYAKNDAVEKICEWGYSPEYASKLCTEYIGRPVNQISTEFETKLNTIKNLKKKQRYKDVCTKKELPIKAIKTLSSQLANSVAYNTTDKNIFGL